MGQLGYGGSTQQNSRVPVGTTTTCTQVATGLLHTLALWADGTRWTWGDNANGQLGARAPALTLT